MNARVWGAHAPPSAGDDALVITNFFFSGREFSIAADKDCFGEGAAATDAKQRPGFPTSTRGRVRSPERVSLITYE
jgi:hypothetical protein